MSEEVLQIAGKRREAKGTGEKERYTIPRSSGCVGTGGPRGATPRFKVRRSGGEEIPLIQGKEQRVRFAGAAVKRYPTSKVTQTQVRR